MSCFRLRSVNKTKTMNLLRIKYLDIGENISQKPEIFSSSNCRHDNHLTVIVWLFFFFKWCCVIKINRRIITFYVGVLETRGRGHTDYLIAEEGFWDVISCTSSKAISVLNTQCTRLVRHSISVPQRTRLHCTTTS